MRNWWTPEDFAHFTASGAPLAKQFDAYRPFPDLAVNGQQTLCENIADVAGLSASYDAYRASLRDVRPRRWTGLPATSSSSSPSASGWRNKVREGAAAPAAADRRPRSGAVPRPDGAQPRRLVRRL